MSENFSDPDNYFSLPSTWESVDEPSIGFYLKTPAPSGGKSIQEVVADLNLTVGWEDPEGNGTIQWSNEELMQGVVYYAQNTVLINVRFPYPHGNNYNSDGVRLFILRMNVSTEYNVVKLMDLRFRAVMIGAVYTDVLGHFTAPALPLYILRDPPGDASYSKFSTTNATCYGNSQMVSNSTSESAWFKAKIGVSGQIGLGVTTDYSLYAQLGVSLEASQSQTSEFEYQTCLETTDEFTTSSSGPPDDLFIGSAIQYAYGMMMRIDRPSCAVVNKSAYFASVPLSAVGYRYTESYIRETVLPNLDAVIASLPVGSAEYRTHVNQRDVWIQTLAMNDNIKATAPLYAPVTFNGGGSGSEHTVSSSTTETMAIDYTVSLDMGLSAEFCAEIGGSGISMGGELKMRNEYGQGATGSNTSTNVMSYHLQDEQADNAFSVKVRRDRVYGTYAFELDSAFSRTSCPYEGGYPLEQPQIWVGAMGQPSMTQMNVPVGTQAIFPIYACNNSNFQRTYKLELDGQSNPNGAIISGYNGITSSSSVLLTIPANGCDVNVGYIYLSQPAPSILSFPNIRLRLSSNCGDDIESSVLLTAHFGEAGLPTPCIPQSEFGTDYGDFVNGVQIGDIDITGSTGAGTSGYVDYTNQLSTGLSRNAQSMITIHGGTNGANWYAAWIDYNRNGEFEANEMLGSFQGMGPYESHNIMFTVPADAVLGATVLRVRTADLGGQSSAMDPCLEYAYGETEDYQVVINDNIPQDCLGVENGMALPGTPCDDGNSSTVNDMYTANCYCEGLLSTAVAEGSGAKATFTVRPNPSTGLFHLNNPTPRSARAEVRDALGRTVLDGIIVPPGLSPIDLSPVPAGIYQLILESEGQRDVIKVMVQH